MHKVQKEFYAKPDSSKDEWARDIAAFIKDIEEAGGYIVGAEPIERIFTKVIGRRFIVEYKDTDSSKGRG